MKTGISGWEKQPLRRIVDGMNRPADSSIGMSAKIHSQDRSQEEMATWL